MSKRKILLVEDEEDLEYAVRMQLEANGFEVISASDGQQALEKARREKPDLIILDVLLPTLDGYKVCRMLKFDEKYKHIPVIMLTARIQDEYKKLGYDVGADFYMTKPFEINVLLRKIRELLGDEGDEKA